MSRSLESDGELVLRKESFLRRAFSAPEFGPFVLLVVELAVFYAINPDFLSILNISNTLTFTVELGLIALAMTLLMTAGEFDLSVGSLFGFAPVMMWTLLQQRRDVAERRVPRRPRRRGADRPRQRTVRHAAQDPVVPRHARHAARRARHGAVRHRRLSAAHLERRRPLARRPPGRRVLHRAVPGLRLALLVRRRGDHSRLRADAVEIRQLDPGDRRQRGRRAGARRRRQRGQGGAVHPDRGDVGLRRDHQLDPHLGGQSEQRLGLRARGHRHGRDRRHGADRRTRARSSAPCSASSSSG